MSRFSLFCLYLLVFLVLCLGAFAQNAPLPTQTFSFNAAPISLPGYDATFVGTDAGITFSPTPNFSLAETNILSSDAKFKFFGGGAAATFPYLSKWINDRSTVSGFRLLLGLRGFVGEGMSASGGNHIGGLIQGTASYSFDSGAKYQMGVQIGAARFPGFSRGWTSIVELGPSIHF